MGTKTKTRSRKELALVKPERVIPTAVRERARALIEASEDAMELLQAWEACDMYLGLMGMPVEQRIKDPIMAAVLEELGRVLRPMAEQVWADCGLENPY